MTHDADARELERLFAELRAATEAMAGRPNRPLRRNPRHMPRRPRPGPALATVLALTAGGGAWWITRLAAEPERDPIVLPALPAWSAPSDILLRVPGHQIVTTIPSPVGQEQP